MQEEREDARVTPETRAGTPASHRAGTTTWRRGLERILGRPPRWVRRAGERAWWRRHGWFAGVLALGAAL
ncbi:MAG: hypothetical protein HOW71_38465, partial [Nonomuraea sp.]|nr:hypothetical protein [Nonomuraea sp.]